MNVIVVGTSHTIQTTNLDLKAFLERLCQQYKICAIAEEMNEEALVEKKCTTSIPMQVADSLQIPHRFCDPDRTERVKLEIYQENDIRGHAFLSNSSLSESEIAARVADSYAKRERYWLKQLHDLNVWPVLFICGANHVESFCRLLRQESIGVHVATEDWASNNTVEGDAPQAARPSL